MTTQPTITLHTTIDDALRHQWQQLFTELSHKNLFRHVAWQQAFIAGRHEPNKHGQPLFALATLNERPVAIVPLLYRTERRYGLPVRIVESMHPTDMGVRDFPIADDIDIKSVFDTVLYKTLPAAGYRWDIAELNGAVENSTLHQAFSAASGLKLAEYDHDSNRLRTGRDRSQCFEHVSKSHVKKTKRKRKNLDAVGKVECELITDSAALSAALDVFVALENAGWKGTEKTSLYHDHPQRRFYESLIANAAPELNCCIAIMRLDGKPIAANVCTRTGDTLWMLKITYADDLNEYSPGNLMLLYLMEELTQAEGIDYISFITGGDWTHRWHPERQPVHWCRIFAGTTSGMIAWSLNHAKQCARTIKHSLIKRKASPKESNETTDNEQ